MKRQPFIYCLLLSAVFALLCSCKKDETPVIDDPEPTKYELVSGDYKVYDTLGAFLYDMNLFYLDGPIINGFKRDSIYFTNFDGAFDFVEYQSNFPSDPNFINIGIQDTLYDANGKRWKILFDTDPIYDNVFRDDTLRMIFRKTNINYWVEDAVPYYECYCKQIAVKQH